jgi:hypothetical protein
MLEDAIMSIRRANAEALQRREALLSRRRPIRQLDDWLSDVEMLMERNEPVVPEPLIGEIARFVDRLDPVLYRRLRRNGKREASQVLDLLFEAEEYLLPNGAERAVAPS